MPLYELTPTSIAKLHETTFGSQAISERADLQRLLKRHVDVIAPDTLVIAEEFGEWDQSKRRIDLLGIDRDANLVVLELKRTEDGGHMELQAIRYAAMISAMTFSDAVDAYARYLLANDSAENAESKLLEFLEWETPNDDEFGKEVRVVLVSAEFSKEITTTVMWLNERDLDIRCVRLRPYMLDARILLDVQQIIPLPEADSYTVQLKKKAQENRTHKKFEFDFSKYDLTVDDNVISQLNKRSLAWEVVNAAIGKGISPEQIAAVLSTGRWLSVDGEFSSKEEFCRVVANLPTKSGGRYKMTRYFCEDDELFPRSGRTYALTNQWALDRLPELDKLIALLPAGTVKYSKRTD